MAEAAKLNAMINALISAVSESSISNFIRQQNRSFVPVHKDLSPLLKDNISFCQLSKLGEIEYADTDRLMVFSCLYDGELSARSARKMQFEIAKQALTADFKDGAIFVFYDAAGRFRFSFIRRNYGNKEQKFSPWKRYTYFVEPDNEKNRTFRERMLSCKFESLDAIQQAFSVEQLTKDFYKELSNWYFWAIKTASYPNDVNDDTDDVKYNNENIIRLITRLIFVWFLRQKDLIKPQLFDADALGEILRGFEPESQTQHNYYRAILQNLFFATLNQEIDKRGFAEDKNFNLNKATYNIKNLYRYENEFQHDTGQIIELFNQVPFLNGGLFECLDNKQKDGKIFDWDGFSRNPHLQAKLPNILFFGSEAKVDLSGEYNDKKMKAVRVTGIIEILKRYNFTVEENTPVEVEVALDPELLGKVFENLLGAFNPETQETARKQTGSFYTPREIVNYMVDESLIAYFQTKVPEVEEETLRNLLSYDDVEIELTDIQCALLIQAIFNCKILDPATGSGAFPMGFLQQMVHILRKLDPNNTHWEKVVMAQAMSDFEATDDLNAKERQNLRAEIEHSFDDSVNYPDYARKLYLIENCIYGVDIQSIAVQICKLRFFISLVCEQNHSNDSSDNFGIRPLPNLETKFVAANTLIGIETSEEDRTLFKQDKIQKLIDKLKQVRHRQFLVTNAQQKKKLRDEDEKLRHDIVTEVQTLYVKRADNDIFRLKMQLKQSEKELEMLNNKPDVIQELEEQLSLFGKGKKKTINITENKRAELKARINLLNTQITDGSKYTKLESVVQLAEQLTSWNPYDQNASSPFFDPEWMFGIKDGFDIVSGNPPYVNVEKIDSLIKKNIRKFNTAFQKYDLYVLFYEKGIELLKLNGQLCFITSNKFLSQGYGLLLRKEFLKHFIHQIVNFNYDIFEAATVRTCIFHIEKKMNFSNEKIKIIDIETSKDSIKFETKAYTYLNQKVFENTSENNFRINLNNQKLYVLNKISKHSTKVEDIFSVNYGLRPSSEKLNLKKEAFIHSSNQSEKFKKYFEGKDMGYWLIKNNSFLDYQPDIMYNSMFPELFETEKLVGLRTLSDITKLRFIYDNNHFYCNDSVVVLTKWHLFSNIKNQTVERNITKERIETSQNYNYHFVQAILNSKIIKFYVNELLYDGTHFYPNHMKSLPIKNAKDKLQSRIIDMVHKIYICSKDEINALENQIDNLVYRLYNLTYEEVKVIDPDIESKISEGEYNLIEIE